MVAGGWYPPLQFYGGSGPRPTMKLLRIDEVVGNMRADMESAPTILSLWIAKLFPMRDAKDVVPYKKII